MRCKDTLTTATKKPQKGGTYYVSISSKGTKNCYLGYCNHHPYCLWCVGSEQASYNLLNGKWERGAGSQRKQQLTEKADGANALCHSKHHFGGPLTDRKGEYCIEFMAMLIGK